MKKTISIIVIVFFAVLATKSQKPELSKRQMILKSLDSLLEVATDNNIGMQYWIQVNDTLAIKATNVEKR